MITHITCMPLQPSDVPAVLELAETAGLSTWSGSDYLAELRRSDSITFAAWSDNLFAGFIVGRVVPSPTEREFDAEIFNIGVAARFRQKGAGRTLIQSFTDSCLSRSIYCIWLEVRSENAPAVAFYEQAGFCEAYRRRNFYSNPVDDALVMKKELGAKQGTNLSDCLPNQVG